MSKIICLDLRIFQIGHEHRGIGMMAKSIIENIKDDENEYIFYTFDNNNPIKKLGIKPGMRKYRIVTTKKLKTAIKSPSDFIDLYRLSSHKFKDLKEHKPDVFVQFDFALGIPRWRNTKTLCFGYDLIPLVMKNKYLPSPLLAMNLSIGKKSKLKALLRSSYYLVKSRKNYSTYKKVDKIISISDATKDSFINILGIEPEKIITIPLAPVGTKNNNIVAPKVEKPYLLYIGGTDSRKRIQDIIFAFNIMRGRGHNLKLVLAGNEFQKAEHIPDNEARDAVKASPYYNDIHLAGFVSDEEKLGLYKDAHAFIFCSQYEGFGLPIIEAQAAGCAVVSYDNSSIREVSGEGVQLVKTGDYVGVANKIIGLKNINKDYTEIGFAKAKEFTWKKTTSKLLEVINDD